MTACAAADTTPEGETVAADARFVPRTLLAFDFGTRRIGVASGSALGNLVTPRAAITSQGDARWAAIERIVREWQPDAVVVGIPRHPDGQPHAITQQAERFARQLEGRLRLPVVRVDERYSSVEAERRGDEGSLDARSAAVILEQYFSQRECAA